MSWPNPSANCQSQAIWAHRHSRSRWPLGDKLCVTWNAPFWEMLFRALHLDNVVFLCLEICPLEEKTSVLPNSLHIFNAISGTPTSTMVHGMTSSSSVVWFHLMDHLWGLALSFTNSGWFPKLITGPVQDTGKTEHKKSRGMGEKGNKELCYFLAHFLEES